MVFIWSISLKFMFFQVFLQNINVHVFFHAWNSFYPFTRFSRCFHDGGNPDNKLIAQLCCCFIPISGKDRQAVAKIGVKNFQAWNDEQIPVWDCLEKLRGYKYMAVVDFDEYIIPEKDENWTKFFVSWPSAPFPLHKHTWIYVIHLRRGIQCCMRASSIGHYLWTSRTRALIFHMLINCVKSFSNIPVQCIYDLDIWPAFKY